MSDWQVGDLAVCVSNSNAETVTVGRTYKVAEVIAKGRLENGSFDMGLRFLGVTQAPKYTGYWHGLFRKVLPDKHEACEEEFAALLKRKPVEHIIGCDGDD